MSITAGGVNGAAADTLDEGIVYVYDSTTYPFYLAVRQTHAYVLRAHNVKPPYLETSKPTKSDVTVIEFATSTARFG